jgi:hypothetical protein
VLDKFKKALLSMISDVDGSVSSKRITTLLCVIAVLITWGVNLFGGIQPAEFVFEGLLYIVVVGLGVATAEKFSRKGTKQSEL